jgi:hypothetical protein
LAAQSRCITFFATFLAKLSSWIVLVCLISVANCVQADDGIRWNFSGFGTLAATGTDTNQIGFYRDLSEADSVKQNWSLTNDSRLGLQLDALINPEWQATVQWIARDHVGNFFEQNLEWAFVRWRAANDVNVRLGRVALDAFMLSEYRNVDYAYPWMQPPHEFYALLPVYHFDGFDLVKSFDLDDDAHWSFKFFGGHNTSQLVVNNTVTGGSMPLVGLNTLYETTNWRARASYVYLNLDGYKSSSADALYNAMQSPALNQVLPNIQSIAPLLVRNGYSIHFASAGWAYDDSVWLLQAEGGYVNTNTFLVPSTASGYLSLGRHFGKVTLYSLLGISQSQSPNIQLPNPVVALPSVVAFRQSLDFMNRTTISEQSVSLGARWDVIENVALKTQWTHYWLGANAPLWNTQNATTIPQEVNVMSVGMDFVF